MIIETIISTLNEDGIVNFAPFGIKRKEGFIYISPYVPSTTLTNLKISREASVNYVNDSSFFVRCITGKKKFPKRRCSNINGFFLKDALAHDEIIVKSINKNKIRPTFKCKIVQRFDHKRFEGFNRAHGSLIEACILASRVKILKRKNILDDLDKLASSIEKTAGLKEKKNWDLIKNYILESAKD